MAPHKYYTFPNQNEKAQPGQKQGQGSPLEEWPQGRYLVHVSHKLFPAATL